MKISLGCKVRIKQEEHPEICEEYKSGTPTLVLAKKYDVDRSTITKILKKHGIETRGHARAAPIKHTEGLPLKQCFGCKETFSINNFKTKYYNGENIGGAYCSNCRKKQYAENRNDSIIYNRNYIQNRKKDDWSSYIFANIKSRCKQKGTILGFDKESFNNWYNSLENKYCEYCNLTVEQIVSIKDNTLSIDRKDNTLGYVPGNIALCCVFCNYIKQDILTHEDMKALGPVLGKRFMLKMTNLNSTEV